MILFMGEAYMSLDKIVVIVLALLFFGGVLLVALKNRQAKSREGQPSSSSANSPDEESFSPFHPKDRRESKK